MFAGLPGLGVLLIAMGYQPFSQILFTVEFEYVPAPSAEEVRYLFMKYMAPFKVAVVIHVFDYHVPFATCLEPVIPALGAYESQLSFILGFLVHR